MALSFQKLTCLKLTHQHNSMISLLKNKVLLESSIPTFFLARYCKVL